MNKKKIILDLCGGTGSWSNPWKKAGYDVRVITLPEYDITETRFGGERINFVSRTASGMVIDPKNVYGILAAPPCTQFSRARRRAKLPPDFKKAMKTVRACLEVVEFCRIYGNPKFWALENPVGLLRQFIGIPRYTFSPLWFGDKFEKPTDLWGYFKEPVKLRKKVESLGSMALVTSSMLPKLPEGYKFGDRDARAARRAITPPKFAKAFYKANR